MQLHGQEVCAALVEPLAEATHPLLPPAGLTEHLRQAVLDCEPHGLQHLPRCLGETEWRLCWIASPWTAAFAMMLE